MSQSNDREIARLDREIAELDKQIEAAEARRRQPAGLTAEQVDGMSVDEINARWPDVQAFLAQQKETSQ